jgi:type IV secretion system protein VirB2
MNRIYLIFRSCFSDMRTMLLLLRCGVLMLAMTEPSAAQNLDSIGTILQSLVDSVTGSIGTALATMAVMAVGFAFMTGRMDWVFAVTIIIGIGIVFAAATFAGTFSAAEGEVPETTP